jgi:predicted dehydrogenase
MTLRIGVLGASRIAELAIVGPAQDLGHRLVAVAARDPQRAASFAEKYGVERVLGSYDEVIADPEVDIVYNPLANSLHATWNIAAVRAGKPVLAEKPYACNAAEARQVAAAAQAAGVPVVEAFHYRYHPVTCRLLDLIGRGDLGELRHVEVDMGMPAPGDNDPRWKLELAGGALMDLGCYALHVVRTVGKIVGATPQVIAARAVERDPGVDARCDVDLRIGDATARSTNSMVDDDYHFTISVVGSRGEALVHNFVKPQEDDRLTIRTAAGDRVERLGTRASYTYQLDAVAAHLADGTPLPVDDTDAIENMTLIDEAYRAAGLPLR